ncbi:MAG: hypothetical protein J5986_12710, partial [Roseburia sp.]|nr:hypothetical protein [Roseburia sp.]
FLRILSCFLPINTPLRKTFSFILLFFPKSGLFSISLVRIIFAFQSWFFFVFRVKLRCIPSADMIRLPQLKSEMTEADYEADRKKGTGSALSL